MFFYPLLLLLVGQTKARLPNPMTVAAIFDQDSDLRHDLMFVNAVKSVNRLRPKLLVGVTLVPLIQKVGRARLGMF